MEHDNRVVHSARFGLVIDRRPKKRQPFPALLGDPGVTPRPHYEHDILRRLNAAGLPFVQKIHYADRTGVILEYVEGEPITPHRWNTDPALRRDYAERIPAMLVEVARATDVLTPKTVRPPERGLWPARLESARHYGDAMKARIMWFWPRVVHGWTAELLRELGGTRTVAEDLAEFRITGDRDPVFIHNDLHPPNTLDGPFTVLDWRNAGQGDLLWQAKQFATQFPHDSESARFIANLHTAAPAAMLRGFDEDWSAHQLLDTARNRLIAAGIMAQYADDALEAVARTNTPQAALSAAREPAEMIHAFVERFAGRPSQITPDETTHLLVEHIGRQLDPSFGVRAHIPLLGPPRAPGHEATPAPDRPHPRVNSTAPMGTTHAAAAGFAPLDTKLPAATPAASPHASTPTNLGPARVPSRTAIRELASRASLRLGQSLHRLG
ncbi:MAG: phosphotransferase [Streptomycetaceae bacterium]|nr:phosphotransferase [Streptomycetaceae bacterium]